jgi:hypothetical protein
VAGFLIEGSDYTCAGAAALQPPQLLTAKNAKNSRKDREALVFSLRPLRLSFANFAVQSFPSRTLKKS